MEMDIARVDRGGERLGVHVRDHQDAAVHGVLDHDRGEPVRPERHARRRERPRRAHAADSGTSLTGSPAAAMAAFTSAIEWMRRWKIDAASTASAPPSRTAATKSAGPAAPPDAMTGTGTRSVIDRRRAVSKPEPVPSRSI